MKLAASCSAADAIRYPRAAQTPYVGWQSFNGKFTTSRRSGLGRLEEFHRTARLLDRRNGSLGRMMHLKGEFRSEFALSKQANARQRPGNHAGGDQRFERHRRFGIELLGRDGACDRNQD